jgi:hypothetical protein
VSTTFQYSAEYIICHFDITSCEVVSRIIGTHRDNERLALFRCYVITTVKNTDGVVSRDITFNGFHLDCPNTFDPNHFRETKMCDWFKMGSFIMDHVISE